MSLPARSVLDRELVTIRSRILQLGELVVETIVKAVGALRSGDR